MAWEKVCKGSAFGGMGVGFLGTHNMALFLKWVWRFGVERGVLWHTMICDKYRLNENALFPHRLCGGLNQYPLYFFDILQVLM